MLRSLPKTRDFSQLERLAVIALFTLITIVFAQIKIPTQPVPFTLQPLAVLLAGMVLGGRDGALALASYVGLIALGLPVDANNIGAAALFGPTGGYLIGFVFAAGVVGLIVENAAKRFWIRLFAGIAGVAVIYLFGVTVLKFHFGMEWYAAWMSGGYPFLGLDIVKALIAAGMAEGTRLFLLRTLLPRQ